MVELRDSREAAVLNKAPKPRWFCVVCVSFILVGLWGFPHVWYTQTSEDDDSYWFSARQSVPGYHFVNQPISEAIERRLVADETFNGCYRDASDQKVIVFMAKRYRESPNEIGLFVHTPDRCWTEGGWKIHPISPTFIELTIHDQTLGFERRVFVSGNRYELVYFLGMVGGQTLPYRLDHNLSVAMKYQLNAVQKKEAGTSLRLVDSSLWNRVFDAFKSRRPLLGPKQFVRVSTSIDPLHLDEGDERLRQFLAAWLVRRDFHEELDAWQREHASSIHAKGIIDG